MTENIECEIMQVVLEDAHSSYKQEIIMEMSSNNIDEMEENVEKIQEWIDAFVAENQG